MFWGSKKNKNKVSFLIDFRSSSVGYALVEENSTVSFIKFFNRKHLFFKKIENTDLYIDEFYKNLKLIINEFFLTDKKLRESVDEIQILLGSPWYEAKYKNVLVDNNQTKITEEFIKDLVQKNIVEDEGETAVEKIIGNYLIDGYTVEQPINKKFKEFKFSVYESFVNQNTKNEIEQILNGFFPKAKIQYHSHPIVMMGVIKKQYPQVSNYMVFDIGGEITEINIINEDKITNFFYIPFGSHAFIRKLISECGLNESTAFSSLNMLLNNHLDNKCKGREHELFKEFTNDWLLNIKNILDKQGIKSTPSNIFIVADNEVKNIIKDAIDAPEGYAGALKNNIKPLSRLLDHDVDEGFIKFHESKKRDCTINIFCEFLRIHR